MGWCSGFYDDYPGQEFVLLASRWPGSVKGDITLRSCDLATDLGHQITGHL